MAAALDEELISLRYYAQQHTSRQCVHLMAAMFAEFQERVDPIEADQFLETLGSRMARSLRLGYSSTISGIVMPDDRSSNSKAIEIRVSRTLGTPPRCSGSETIHFSMVNLFYPSR